MELLVPLLSFCLGGAGALLVFAALATVYRARIMHALTAHVINAMGAARDELLAKVRQELAGEAKALADTLIAARSERGRLMALLRHHGKASAASEEEEGEADEGGEPGFLDGLAQSLGVDVEKLAAGDPNELGKVQAALSKLGGAAAPAKTTELFL